MVKSLLMQIRVVLYLMYSLEYLLKETGNLISGLFCLNVIKGWDFKGSKLAGIFSNFLALIYSVHFFSFCSEANNIFSTIFFRKSVLVQTHIRLHIL